MEDDLNVPCEFHFDNIKKKSRYHLLAIAKIIRSSFSSNFEIRFDLSFNASQDIESLAKSISSGCIRAYHTGEDVTNLLSVLRNAPSPIRQTRLLDSTTVLNKPWAPRRPLRQQLDCIKKSIFYDIVQLLHPTLSHQASSRLYTYAEILLERKSIMFLNTHRDDKKIPGIKLFCIPVKEMRAPKNGGTDQVYVKFPETCELRINGSVINVNLHGKNQKPGSTRPPDLHPHVKISNMTKNKIELIHTSIHESYLAFAQAVLITPIDQIVEDIVTNKSISASATKAKLFSGCDEDDLVATVELSLKCPLSFSRITHPFRSMHCTHAQCFDGHKFLQMNEQMETWECPICQCIMDPFKDLIHDEFFHLILETTSSDTESVMVASDGSWHLKGIQSDSFKMQDVVELLSSSCEQSPVPTECIDLTNSD